jgi:hydrogenase maturation protein HypF
LFDAAAAMVCKLPNVSHEAQGPMQLESLCTSRQTPIVLPLDRDGSGVYRTDWEPLLPMLGDETMAPERRAEIFHCSLATVILDQAIAARSLHALERVGLTGGVFQNNFLATLAVDLLKNHGFDVHLPLKLPCNDAALSFGQIAEYAARGAEAETHG